MRLRNYSLSVAALLFFINGACFAQQALSQLPDTPAASQAKGWLEVFNAGDVEKRRTFFERIIRVAGNALIAKQKCDAGLVVSTS